MDAATSSNAATTLVAPLKPLDASTLTTDADWGTDNFDFLLEGVPTFVANQEEANYLLNYHAMSDTFDKVDLVELRKHVVEASALTIGLANAPDAPGPRLHHAQIEQTLPRNPSRRPAEDSSAFGATGKVASAEEKTRMKTREDHEIS